MSVKKVKSEAAPTTLERTAKQELEEMAFCFALPVLCEPQNLLESRTGDVRFNSGTFLVKLGDVCTTGNAWSIEICGMRQNKVARKLMTLSRDIRKKVVGGMLEAGPLVHLRDQHASVGRGMRQWLTHAVNVDGLMVGLEVSSSGSCEVRLYATGVVIYARHPPELERRFLRIRAENDYGRTMMVEVREFEYETLENGNIQLSSVVFDEMQRYYTNMVFCAEQIKYLVENVQYHHRTLVSKEQDLRDRAVVAANSARFADVEQLLAGVGELRL